MGMRLQLAEPIFVVLQAENNLLQHVSVVLLCIVDEMQKFAYAREIKLNLRNCTLAHT